MCVSPILVRNPKKSFNNLVDSLLLRVPCGNCWQCRLQRKNSAWLKMHYEYEETELKGGFTYFLTLTYKQSRLPRLLGNLPCFRHRDVQLFLKRIRKVVGATKVRYWFCMEYGSRTHRPHYHIVFFVTGYDFWLFRQLAKKEWSINGYSKCGKFNYGRVTSSAGLRYCAKYVAKQLTDEDYLRKVFNYISGINARCKDCKLASYVTDKMRYLVTPRTRGSNSLGMYVASVTSYDDLLKCRCLAPDKRGVQSYVNLPLCFQRKLFYNIEKIDNSPRYVLNDFGFCSRSARYEDFRKNFVNRVTLVRTIPLDCSFFSRINSRFNLKISSYDEIVDFANLNDYDFVNKLFVYSLNYQGLSPCYESSSFHSGSLLTFRDDYLTRLHLQQMHEVPFENFLYNSYKFNADESKKSFYDLSLQIIDYLFMLHNLQHEKDDISYQKAYETNRYKYLIENEL